MERGKGDSISQTIVGPGNILLSGGNAEHCGSRGQMADSVEMSEFLERLFLIAWHCVGSARRRRRVSLPHWNGSRISRTDCSHWSAFKGINARY